jgi:hypothetical protein
MEIKITPDGTNLIEQPDEILKRSAETINGPRHDQIELAARDRFQHGVEPRPLVPALGAGDARILENLSDTPSSLIGDGLKSLALVKGGLPGGRDPEIEGCTLWHGEHSKVTTSSDDNARSPYSKGVVSVHPKRRGEKQARSRPGPRRLREGFLYGQDPGGLPLSAPQFEDLDAIADFIGFNRHAPEQAETFLRFAVRHHSAADAWAIEAGLALTSRIERAIRSRVVMAVVTGFMMAAMAGSNGCVARMSIVERLVRSAASPTG